MKEDDPWNSQNNKERATQYVIQQKLEALMQLANNTTLLIINSFRKKFILRYK